MFVSGLYLVAMWWYKYLIQQQAPDKQKGRMSYLREALEVPDVVDQMATALSYFAS